MIVYKEDDNGVVWLRMDDLLDAIKTVAYSNGISSYPIGKEIADQIELLVLRDRNKHGTLRQEKGRSR